MTFEEARNIIAKDGFARYIVVKSESETPKYPSWNPMPCQSKAFVEAVRYLCLSGYEVLRDSEIDEYDKKHGFMTLDEAKKILEKEGYSLGAQGKPGVVSGAFLKYESPEICEAMQTVCSAGYEIMMFGNVFEARKERLQKEYEKNIKAPGSAENRIKEDSGVTPALKESASQFNDALLDEQAKKIAELTKENERLKDQIAVLDACKKHNDKTDRLQIKRLGKEIARLNGIIHDKNEEIKRKTKGCCGLVTENVDLKKKLSDKDAVLSDVAEELRLSKIREKNLTEVGQKYMKENEELKKLLADKVGNGIDWKRNADAIKLYVNRASHERLWNPINQDICNEKELSFIINHGGKRVKYALRFDGTDIVYECSDPDKKPRIPTSEESREDFIKKTIDNYNRIAANLGCVGSKGGNGIIDQMVGIDIAEEGADHSGVIVLCGKDFIKKFKENEDFFHDLFEKKHKEIKEFMSAEAEQFFEGDGIPTKMEVMEPSRKFKKDK